MKALTIQEKDEKIFSPLRDKWLEKTPEEEVRQNFICKLVNEYGYSLDQMGEEIKLTNSQRGTGRASADLLIWKTAKEKQENKTAFLVVEFKASYLDLRVEDCYQGYNYATWSRAKLFAVSNGKELQVYKTVEEELPLSLQPVNDIPKADEILDDNKLDNFLTKTKEFTGDEFARVLQKCHNIIRNNDKLSPESAFDEISKILFIKIMYERKPRQEAIFSKSQFEKEREELISNWEKEISNQIIWNENEKERFIKEGKFDDAKRVDNRILEIQKSTPPSIMEKLFEDVKTEFSKDNIFDEYEKITLRETSFEQIVKELEIYNLTSTSSDIKGIAFEKFLGKTLRGELGQFFTPRTIVDFMVKVLDPKESDLIADPACGSGGFLIKAFETVRDQIDLEFIERKKSKQKELFGENLESIDNKKLNEQYENFLKEINTEKNERINTLSHKSIFGTDANPRMARVSKMNMIMHGDGHNGIYHNDGLLNINGMSEERFNIILANPPFGSRVPKELIVEGNEDTSLNGKTLLSLYDTGKMSTLTEVLFIERCLNLLKKGGRMGIVLPEGVLNNSNLQNVREYFEGKAKIILIVSIPQDVFVASGATVKPSLVFLKKFTKAEETEYAKISEEAKQQIDEKYRLKIENLEKKIKEEKTATGKKIFKAEIKKLNEKKEEEIKRLIKEKFDYAIPIAEIEKAGISTTGTKIENELEPLATEFAEYRKTKNLWE